MATRSTIALEFADGTVEQIYCHWDGYLAHNGKILRDHYSNPFILRDLIDQGAISSLGPIVGTKHDFSRLDSPLSAEEYESRYGTMTTFYARDRGEELIKNKFKSFEEYQLKAQREEYDYILRNIDGKAVWFVSDHDGAYTTLESAIMDEQDNEATA